jgi:hypothetical protein
MIGVEDDHLGCAARLPARLDDARKRVVALHERNRSRRGAAAGEELLGRADGREIGARSRSELEEHAFGAGERQDGIHRVLHRVDEARGALRRFFETAVEPDRAVEGGLLIHEDVLEVVAERLQILVAREVLVLAAPRRDRVDHAADQLLDAVLPLRRADLTAKIFRDDDVGGLLRPGLRNLDIALLEDQLSALVANQRRAKLPLDFIERIDARLGKEAGEDQTCRRLLPGLDRLRPRQARSRMGSTRFDRLLAGTGGLIGCAFLHLQLRLLTDRTPAPGCNLTRFQFLM